MRHPKNALIVAIALAAVSAGFAGSASAVTNVRIAAGAPGSSGSGVPGQIVASPVMTSPRPASDRAIIIIGGSPAAGSSVRAR